MNEIPLNYVTYEEVGKKRCIWGVGETKSESLQDAKDQVNIWNYEKNLPVVRLSSLKTILCTDELLNYVEVNGASMGNPRTRIIKKKIEYVMMDLVESRKKQ